MRTSGCLCEGHPGVRRLSNLRGLASQCSHMQAAEPCAKMPQSLLEKVERWCRQGCPVPHLHAPAPIHHAPAVRPLSPKMALSERVVVLPLA